MPFTIIRNDITKVQTDAVVNAANNSLLGGGGVDGAIHKAAGEKLLRACRKLGGCLTGQAKLTKGYNMPCRYIIHTVGPVWQGGNSSEEALLYSCYKNSLELAKEYKCSSIAFPLISAGAYGYPRRQALDVAEKAISDFLKENEMDIMLVVFDKESAKLSSRFADEIKSYIDDVYAEEHYQERYDRTDIWNMSMPMPDRKPVKRSPEAAETKSFAGVYPDLSFASLEDQLMDLDMSFREKLFGLIDISGMKDSEVYKSANISKQVFSKIRSDKKYHPKKLTVFAFAIALRLTISQTEDLLRSAGYALTRSDRTDIIIGYFIERGAYNVYDINEVLFDYDLPLIGG